MKPVRLTIQAFGPYPTREVIDFKHAVEAGLFGIYGQTGSGKSTIFSAISFALFGQPAKSEQETPSLRSDHAEPAIQTEVEFVFDLDSHRYVIVRRPDQLRPKQRGEGETRSQHEAYFFDATGIALTDINDGNYGKIIAERKVRDVDTAISELLGYGPDQFRQIVLLPQGRFEAFLAAKTKERLAILRDLFDVSIFRSLASKLKDDADSSERQVRLEREVCTQRLAAEGFESQELLAHGVSQAKELHEDLRQQEEKARLESQACQTALTAANEQELRFKAASDAAQTLSELEEASPQIELLYTQVQKAERARSLVDANTNVSEANTDVANANLNHKRLQKEAADAAEKSAQAAAAFEVEKNRAADIDKLQRSVEEFDRHKLALEKSAGIATALKNAQASELQATGLLQDAQKQLSALLEKRTKQSDLLKSAQGSVAARHSIATRIADLKTSIAVAEAFEKARKDLQLAQDAVSSRLSEHTVAVDEEARRRAEFEEAEHSLSTQQALHLSSKLASGEPCPVCGATEHPTPATGSIEHSGRDQSFRNAKAAWQKAHNNYRELETRLAAEQSVLAERKTRLGELAQPIDRSTALKIKLQAEQEALASLGTKIDLNSAEAELERFGSDIAAAEQVCSVLRDSLHNAQNSVAAEKSRLEESLSAVPTSLRDAKLLATARAKATAELTNRQNALERATSLAKLAHDNALEADRARQIAEAAAASHREVQAKAIEFFNNRLLQEDLSEAEFQTLKSSIPSIERDRATVEAHRRKLENANEMAAKTAEAVHQQLRPDLSDIQSKSQAASDFLNVITSKRTDAEHRVKHLSKLHNELAETLRKLDDAENSSGALRNLAALFDGKNQLNTDLETFAIGAMFDQVLEAANIRLGPMTTDRYRLERELEANGRGKRGLGIQVFDSFTGKARPTATLSGGEVFIAALALALGLADVVESTNGKVRLDTIFIDEGFGSLDTENGSGTLEQVLQVLSSLVSQNRVVGLISHVPLVQEAIPNGFYVRKNVSGSTVESRSGL